MKLTDTPVRVAIRLVVGVSFVGAGLVKGLGTIQLGAEVPDLPEGAAAFAEYLAAAGVPFPTFNAHVVPMVEVLCGVGLMLGAVVPSAARLTRLPALGLAGNMAVAMAVVGIRTALGRPVVLRGVVVTNEPWRLPLELAFFLVALYFLWRPTLDARPARSLPGPAPSR